MQLTLRRLGLVFLLTLPLTARAPFVQVHVQNSPCDPNLKQLGQNPNGYKLRGDRCEGIYVQPVSGSTALLVASFTELFEDFDPSSLGNLSVEWSHPVETTIHLRAYALHEKLYYQMDAVVPAGRNSYLWPGDVLNALQL